MDTRLCEAIRSRSRIHIVYHGASRLVEPHCYGVSAKGRDILRAFQVSGESSSGGAVGWRLFNVEEITQIVVEGGQFEGPRQGYKKGDPACSQRIYCEV